MRDALTEYKCAGGARHADALTAMLKCFLDMHSGAAAAYFGGAWDTVAPVPSTQARGGDAVAHLGLGAGLQVRRLLRSTGKVGQHRRYDLRLFDAGEELQGRRVLILEDAYVSGARSQTAAATLRAAGAVVVGILALGRRVNPDFNDCSRRFWARRPPTQASMAESFRWLTGSRQAAV
jgi:predicted amidophosphoribosyltransferase